MRFYSTTEAMEMMGGVPRSTFFFYVHRCGVVPDVGELTQGGSVFFSMRKLEAIRCVMRLREAIGKSNSDLFSSVACKVASQVVRTKGDRVLTVYWSDGDTKVARVEDGCKVIDIGRSRVLTVVYIKVGGLK